MLCRAPLAVSTEPEPSFKCPSQRACPSRVGICSFRRSNPSTYGLPARADRKRCRSRGLGVGREPFRSLPAVAGITYIAFEDVGGLHARVVAAGGDIAVDPLDTDYGSRDFAVRDPAGHLWSFGTYRTATQVS